MKVDRDDVFKVSIKIKKPLVGNSEAFIKIIREEQTTFSNNAHARNI